MAILLTMCCVKCHATHVYHGFVLPILVLVFVVCGLKLFCIQNKHAWEWKITLFEFWFAKMTKLYQLRFTIFQKYPKIGLFWTFTVKLSSQTPRPCSGGPRSPPYILPTQTWDPGVETPPLFQQTSWSRDRPLSLTQTLRETSETDCDLAAQWTHCLGLGWVTGPTRAVLKNPFPYGPVIH